MKNFLNPPCNSSLATSCSKSVMVSSCGEGKVATLFTEGVSRGSWQLMRLRQRSVQPQMFVLYLERLRLWKKARSASTSLWVL